MTVSSPETTLRKLRPHRGRLSSARSEATFAEQIARKVTSALLDRTLVAGEPLGSEKDFAAAFGVSRMAARDALRDLAARGIVEIRVGAGGGIRVAGSDPRMFGDALAVQIALSGASRAEVIDAQMGIEERAAELAARTRTNADLAAIEAAIDAAEAAREDAAEFLRLGLEFHRAMVAASHNRVLLIQFEALNHVVWTEQARDQVRQAADRVLAVHRNIFDAVATGDSGLAKKLMRDHVTKIAHEDARGVAPICC